MKNFCKIQAWSFSRLCLNLNILILDGKFLYVPTVLTYEENWGYDIKHFYSNF